VRHYEVIEMLVRVYKPKVYLELGLYLGETFNRVKPLVVHAVGVDKKPNGLGGEVHECTTDEFFAFYKGKVDMVFIDADHCYKSVRKDFYNSLAILNEGGVIILHDTDPAEEKWAAPGYCGDAYRFLEELEFEDHLSVYTLPVGHEGLTIVTRVKDKRVNSWRGA